MTSRGLIYHAMGFPARADAAFADAEHLFAETSQVLESVYMVHNRALVASSINDIPTALSYFAAAASRYESLNVLVPELAIDRCVVLLAGGLVTDALAEADDTVREIERIRRPVHQEGRTPAGRGQLRAGRCATAGRPGSRRGRPAPVPVSAHNWGWPGLGLVLVRAKFAAEPVSGKLLRDANQAARRLEELSSSDAPQAHLLAGRVALDLGRRDAAERHLIEAAKSRGRGPALSRASGWLSEALRAEAAGHPRRLLAACRRGLEVLDEYRFTLGASELRAQATAHGAELAVLAQRHALRQHRPRQLLAWSERWRATALAVPQVRPSASAEINAGLTAFRKATSQLEEARQLGRPNARRSGNSSGWKGWCARARCGPLAGRPRAPAWSTSPICSAARPGQLAEIVDVDGVLYVLVCGAGRVRQFTAGRAADAVRAADFARFALRRLAQNRPGDDPGSALAVLAAAGPRLQDALFGPAAGQLGDGPVVVVPPGKLHAIPWALLPVLQRPRGQRGPVGERLDARTRGRAAGAPPRHAGPRAGPEHRRRRGAARRQALR